MVGELLSTESAARPRFRKFVPAKQMKSTSFCMFIGRRGSGKTCMIKEMAYRLHKRGCMNGDKIDTVMVFSPTECMQKAFETFVPGCFIYDSYREDVVISLIETQKQLLKKNGHTKTVLVILDDVAFDKKFFCTNAFRELAMNGRHCKICVMCAVQYCMDVPPAIRNNIDLTFAMKDNSSTNKKRMHANLFSQFNDLRTFSKTYDTLTENHSAIVSLNNSSSTVLEETVFSYRADLASIPESFRFGAPIFWALDDRCRPKDAADDRWVAAEHDDEHSDATRMVEPVHDATSVEFVSPPELASLERPVSPFANQCHGADRRRETSSIVRGRQPTFPQILDVW